jgi:hypothetical protein
VLATRQLYRVFGLQTDEVFRVVNFSLYWPVSSTIRRFSSIDRRRLDACLLLSTAVCSEVSTSSMWTLILCAHKGHQPYLYIFRPDGLRMTVTNQRLSPSSMASLLRPFGPEPKGCLVSDHFSVENIEFSHNAYHSSSRKSERSYYISEEGEKRRPQLIG